MSITIHQEGIDAAINAQANGFDGATLSKVELWNQIAKIKHLNLQGVAVIEPSRIYVVATDSSSDVYEVYELRFYTDTNVLFATAKNDDSSIIQAKSAQASLALAHTLNLSAEPGTVASSGDLSLYAQPADEDKLGTVVYAKEDDLDQSDQQRKTISPSWLWKWWDSAREFSNIKNMPAASTTILGIAELATQSETDTGTDDSKIVTPAKLKKRLDDIQLFSPGMILMWSGAINAVPDGWQLCNGVGTTSTNIPVPDLRDKFIVGAGGAYESGTYGGSVSKTTSNAGSHNHSVTVNNTTLSTAQMPIHTHQQKVSGLDNNQGQSYGYTVGNPSPGYNGKNNRSYDYTFSSGGSQPHKHSASLSSAGEHNHTITDIRPPYYALAFIIKL